MSIYLAVALASLACVPEKPPGDTCEVSDALIYVGSSLLSASTTAGVWASIQATTSGADPREVAPAGPDLAEAERRKKQERFVAHTGAELNRDVARGQGEYLAAWATLLGCTDAVRPRLYAELRQRHGDVFADPAPANAVVSRSRAVVRADPLLAAACGPAL